VQKLLKFVMSFITQHVAHLMGNYRVVIWCQ